MRPHLFLVVVPLALLGCGGKVFVQSSAGAGGEGGGPLTGGVGQGGEGSVSSSSAGSAGGAGGSVDCDGLGEVACLKAYPSCVPVYDDQCCPLCEPEGYCADCVNWAYHHCATLENGCLPEEPVECGTVPGWACAGGQAECEAITPMTKIPCATVPGCVASYCPMGGGCGTDPVCVPVQKDICDPALCNTVPPPCFSGTVAAVEGGCYTGGCIPESYCAP